MRLVLDHALLALAAALVSSAAAQIIPPGASTTAAATTPISALWASPLASSSTILGAAPMTTAKTTLQATATTTAGASHITFNADDFSYNALFTVYDTSKQFSFTAAPSVTVTRAVLYQDSDGGGQEIGSASVASSGIGRRADSVELGLTFSGSAGIITLANTSQIYTENFSNSSLYFGVFWDGNSATGKVSGETYCQRFAFVNAAEAAAEATWYTDTSPAYPEATSTTSTATTAKSSATTAHGSATASSTLIASASSAKKKSSGLAGGAIGGIVVGVVVLIAIVAAIAFFFYRRRRNNAAAKPDLYNGSVEPYRGAWPAPSMGSGPANLQGGFDSGMMAEKGAAVDATGARFQNGADGGAHSRYSDEDVTHDIPLQAGAAAPAASSAASPAAAQPPPATRQVNGSAPVSPIAAAAVPAAATPAPAVSGQVAALIDEGMTAEDVARLEAEERELDAAIESARLNRAAGR